jgi:hypothetical protein
MRQVVITANWSCRSHPHRFPQQLEKPVFNTKHVSDQAQASGHQSVHTMLRANDNFKYIIKSLYLSYFLFKDQSQWGDNGILKKHTNDDLSSESIAIHFEKSFRIIFHMLSYMLTFISKIYLYFWNVTGKWLLLKFSRALTIILLLLN